MKKCSFFNFVQLLAAFLLVGTTLASSVENTPSATNTLSFSSSNWISDTVIHPDHPYEVIPGKDPNGWSAVIEPYGWAPALAGDVAVKGLPSAHISPTSKDLLKHLDWGAFLKGEVRKGRWGIIGDGFFTQLSTSANPPGPLYNSTTVKFQQGMASVALAYRLIDDRRWFLDVYAGARLNYMNINLGTSVDSQAIQNLSQEAAAQITQQATSQANAIIASNTAAAQQAISSQVSAAQQALVSNIQQQLSQSTLVQLVQAVPSIEAASQQLTPVEKKSIEKSINQSESAIQGLVAAAVQRGIAAAQAQVANAQLQVAAAKNQVTTALQNRVSQAQSNLAQAQNTLNQAKNNLSQVLSKNIANQLPTSGVGTQTWVDPIIGLRTQINLTRVLFLAAQADVGGFGAGSQIAWNVTATAGVNFTRQVYGEVGYRYFYMDYSNSSGGLYNAAEYGVFAGIGFKF